MRKLIVSEFLTLDGVAEAPDKWNLPFMNEETGKVIRDDLFKVDSLLYGRVTYQSMAATWPSRTGEIADRFNSLPKFVVSTALEEAPWNNSRLIKENIAEEVYKLKQQPGQGILVWGSCALVQTLMRHDLIDEYVLWIHPIVLGSGKRLFPDGFNATLRLVESTQFSTGVVALTYRSEKRE